MNSSPSEESRESNPKEDLKSSQRSWFKTAIVLITWIELIIGLSAVAAAVFMNPRVPALLYALYGVYFAIFLGLLYFTFRSAYLQTGPLVHAYWICVGCTLATIGVVLLTFLTSPNSGDIAFVAAIVFCVSLVLSPVITAIFFCVIRGNLIIPEYMRGKKTSQFQKGFDEVDGQNQSQNGTQNTQISSPVPHTQQV